MTERPLWTTEAMTAAMHARGEGRLPPAVTGLSIDSRTIEKGDAFFAIAGEAHDGHAFVEAALAAGAGLAVVAARQRDSLSVPADAPLLVVDDVLASLGDLARAARARMQAKVIAVTGSVGKTGTKEALRLALSADGPTHASVASYNNHWGVPLSLARCPQDARFAIFEIGMNHAGEIIPLTKLVRPHIAIVTTIEPVHLEFFESIAAIADAKAEIFEGLEPGGVAVLNRDNEQFARLRDHAQAKGARVVSFGADDAADARLIKCVLQPNLSIVQANILGHEVAYKLGAPGRHVVVNSLAVLAATALAGADLALAALALGELAPPQGRGSRRTLYLPKGTALLIDESFNANPSSMRAAFALLGQQPVVAPARRVAVLGDMLELGAQAGAMHRALVEPLVEAGIDLVYCAGPAMRHLWEALPSARRGGYAGDAKSLEPIVLDAVQRGDAVMVKGSKGSKVSLIAASLERRYAQHNVLEKETLEENVATQAATQG
jgi:UDP-N-acetylmuramoyl-tripeptide--D-alanyl-D-alanine ligase